jgi:glutathione S-transferase
VITVHHLNDSRSQRVLWLLEELGLPYEIVPYTRDPVTRLAPPALERVHPLGKAPIVTEDGLTLIESGAIVESLIRRHGQGRLQPPAGTPEHEAYMQWLHYAEGSAMLPLMLSLYVARLGEAGAPLHPRIADETARHIGFIDRSLAGKAYLLGESLTGADIQMSFVGEVVAKRHDIAAYPAIDAWVARFQARPAYRAALARGGAYGFCR